MIEVFTSCSERQIFHDDDFQYGTLEEVKEKYPNDEVIIHPREEVDRKVDLLIEYFENNIDSANMSLIFHSGETIIDRFINGTFNV